VETGAIRGKPKKEKTLYFLKSTGFLTNQIKTYLLQD